MILGKYESIGTLGKGTLWELRAARPISDPARTVVIKILGPEFAQTPAAKDFFEQETRCTANLHHPYIMHTFEAGVDEELGPCLVMEFVPGHPLDFVLKSQKALPLNRVARLAGCLCHGLHAAHSIGVIHRDIKPANLMVVHQDSPAEILKIKNFGLSRLNSKPMLGREQISSSYIVFAHGTSAYLSPEQLRGEIIDIRSDLYSAGIILYEALTGTHPFPLPTDELIMQAHLRQVPPRFCDRQINHVPLGLESTVLRCLGKFISERPCSARMLADELSRSFGFDIWEATAPRSSSPSSDGLPIAEPVPDTPPVDPWRHVRQAEAWMPDQIAMLKIDGFLKDHYGELCSSEPGLVKARFISGGVTTGFVRRLFNFASVESIDLDIELHRPIQSSNRILLTLNFHPTTGIIPADRSKYFLRCEYLFDEIRKYLM